MKKMEFMQYAATEIAAYCGDLYRTGKITNFNIKCEYTRVAVRTKTHNMVCNGTLEFVFYSSGKIVAKGHAFDDFNFETFYYDWTEDTATKEIVKKLKADLKSALSVENFYDAASCFSPD